MFERLSWAVRMRLADYVPVLRYRALRIAVDYPFEDGPYARFLDLVSPFDSQRGYRRRRLRRLLYIVRHPRHLRLDLYRFVGHLILRFVGHPHAGRYEGMGPSLAMKVEWLDDHSEYADATTGDSGWLGGWTALFLDLDVPWSRDPESWSINVDSQGFVTGWQYDDADEARDDFARTNHDYVYDPENEDEFGGPDDSGPWSNPEGDPTLNGAFGGTQVAQ